MSAKRQNLHDLTDKENIDSVMLERAALEKLNTFSEEFSAMLPASTEFSGWVDSKVLNEQVNRSKMGKSPRFDRIDRKDFKKGSMGETGTRIFVNRRTMDTRRRALLNDQNAIESKTGIYLLKKQAQFLESQCPTEMNLDKSKFPKKQDLIQTPKTPQMSCYPTHNNFFSSGQKFSDRQFNRQRIKNLRKLSLKNPSNYASLLMSPHYCKILLQQTLAKGRPLSSSNQNHSHRVHSQKNEIAFMEVQSKPRYIPSSFKKCRMNKRNRSAKQTLNESREDEGKRKYRYKTKKTENVGPLDDLLKIRFPDFF